MKKLLITTAISLAISGNAFADNTDTQTVTVSGNVIKELTVEAPDIIMPDVVKPGAGEAVTTVDLDCTANSEEGMVVSYTGKGNPFAAGNAGGTAVSQSSKNLSAGDAGMGDETGDCGIANVSGQPFFAYKIDTTTLGTTPTNNGVTLKSVTCTSENNALDDTGSETLYCGAKVEVASSAGEDYEIASAQLTVTYD